MVVDTKYQIWLNFQRAASFIRNKLAGGPLEEWVRMVGEQGRPAGEQDDLIADWK